MNSQNAIEGAKSITCPEGDGGQEAPREAGVSRGMSQEEALVPSPPRDKICLLQSEEDSPRS